MMTRRGLALAAAACALLRPAASWAQDQQNLDNIDWPNVFISPFGQPFRAAMSAPYPVVNWFRQADKNKDGRIDKSEFLADAEAFFKILDINGDGFLGSQEVAIYEHRIAPEILGYSIPVADNRSGARLWLTQIPGTAGGMDPGQGLDGNGEVSAQDQGPPHTIDESGQGASPYSFFQQPEPVAAADLDFNGRITKANFLRLADAHFDDLDPKELGYLTLDTLPKTRVQKVLERKHRHKAS